MAIGSLIFSVLSVQMEIDSFWDYDRNATLYAIGGFVGMGAMIYFAISCFVEILNYRDERKNRQTNNS